MQAKMVAMHVQILYFTLQDIRVQLHVLVGLWVKVLAREQMLVEATQYIMIIPGEG